MKESQRIHILQNAKGFFKNEIVGSHLHGACKKNQATALRHGNANPLGNRGSCGGFGIIDRDWHQLDYKKTHTSQQIPIVFEQSAEYLYILKSIIYIKIETWVNL